MFTSSDSKRFFKIQIALLISFFLLRLIGFFYLNQYLELPKNAFFDTLLGLLSDLQFIVFFSIFLFLIYSFVRFISKKFAHFFQLFFDFLLLISGSALLIYFAQRGSALDFELVQQSLKESLLVVKNSGSFQWDNFLLVLTSIVLFIGAQYLILNNTTIKKKSVSLLNLILIIAFILSFFSKQKLETYNEHYQLRSNNIAFLLHQIYQYETSSDDVINSKLLSSSINYYHKNINFSFMSNEYPLLHKNSMKDVLGPFMKPLKTKPNIVIVIVESLSASMSGAASEYHGLITPYFDSLCTQGLYWSNCLSSSEISFEVLPSVIASAPYGKEGFNMISKIPNHQSIIKTLNKADYFSAFISGSPIYFANQGAFMRNQHTRFIINKFDDEFERIKNNGGWSWGYSDDVLFRQGLKLLDSVITPPYINVFVTITSHPPYKYPGDEKYQADFVKQINRTDLISEKKAYFIKKKQMFAAFRSFDDELKHFIESYKQRDDYQNTIFIITGDHQGYFNVINAADNFRVPLLIYGDPVKKPVHFESVALHAQIAPTLSNYLHSNYQIPIPHNISYLADVIDTVKTFRNKNAYPFIYANKEIRDYIYHDYYLNGNQLYRIKGPKLDLVSFQNDSVKQLMKSLLNSYKVINREVCFENKIIPDSLYEYKTIIRDELFTYQANELLLSNSMFPLGTRFNVDGVLGEIEFQISFKMKSGDVPFKSLPRLVISIENTNSNKKKFYDSKELKFLTEKDIKAGEWINYNTVDILNTSQIQLDSEDVLKVYIYNSRKLNLEYSDFEVKIFQN